MYKNNIGMKFWNSLRRNAEVEGSGGAVGETSGDSVGEGEVVAADSPPPPATTFLNEAGKPAEASAEGEVPPAGEEEKPAEPPAAFDVAALTLPEGLELPEEMGKAFAELLDDGKLTSQERGQKLIDMYSENMKAAAEQLTQANMDLWKSTNDGWREEIKNLPEFKNNPDAEAGKVMQALTSVGAGEEFFAALDMTGAGNNPAILQVLHRLAQPFMEGGAVQGQGAAKAARQLGANIYTSAKKD